jgi:hypothetical protein
MISLPWKQAYRDSLKGKEYFWQRSSSFSRRIPLHGMSNLPDTSQATSEQIPIHGVIILSVIQ